LRRKNLSGTFYGDFMANDSPGKKKTGGDGRFQRLSRWTPFGKWMKVWDNISMFLININDPTYIYIHTIYIYINDLIDIIMFDKSVNKK